MRTSPNWYRSTINCCCCTQAWVSIRATTVDNKALKTMPQSALGEDVMPQPVNDAPAYSEAGGGKVQDDQGQQERFKHFNQYLDNPPTCHLWPEGRQQCPKCTGRVRFYCPNCMTFVGKPDQVKIPDLRLPLEVRFYGRFTVQYRSSKKQPEVQFTHVRGAYLRQVDTVLDIKILKRCP